MTKITVGTPLIAPITPGSDDSNEWPTHHAKYGAGGFEIVNTISERNSLSQERIEGKAVLVRDSDGNGNKALYECKNKTWSEIELNKGIVIYDKDGANMSDIKSLQFINGKLVSSTSSAEAAIELDGSGTGGSSLSITDGFDKKSDDVIDLKIKNSLLTKVNNQDVLEIETGIEVLGDGKTSAVDGVKQLEFPQATLTHDSNNGDTKLEFDLDFKGFNVRGRHGNPVSGVKDITFKHADVYVDDANRAYVTTLTGVDIGADNQVFNGIERVNFNDTLANHVHDDGSLYLTPQIKFSDMAKSDSEEGNTSNAYNGISNKLNVYPPLMAEDDAEELGSVKVSIDPSAYESQRGEGYLAYLPKSIALNAKNPGDDDAYGYLWFDEVVYGRNVKYLNVSKKDQSITINKLDKDHLDKSAYFIALKVHSFTRVSGTGEVAVSIVDMLDQHVAVNDSEGNPLAKSITLKPGEMVGDIYISGVITTDKPEKLRFKVESTAGDIVISGRDSGISGIVIQAVNENESTGVAIRQWASDTGFTPFIKSYPVLNNFVVLPSIKSLEAEGFTNGKTHPAKTHIKTFDDWVFYADNSFVTKTDTDTLYIDDTNWFYMGTILDKEKTYYLNKISGGVSILSKVKLYQPNFWLVAAKWTGDAESIKFPVVTGYNGNGTGLIYSPGWVQFDQKEFVGDESGNVTEAKANFLIPDDANNVAFFFVPDSVNAPDTGIGPGAQFGIQNMTISPSNPGIVYEVENISGDVQNYKSISGILDTTSGGGTVIDVGKVPVSIAPNVQGVNLFEDGQAPISRIGSDIQFDAGGSVLCTFSAMMHVSMKVSGLVYTNNDQGNIRFYAEIFDKNKISKGIVKSSKRFLWLPEEHAGITPEITFPCTVAEGDFIRFYVQADKDGVVGLEYMPGASNDKNLVYAASFTYLTKSRQILSSKDTGVSVNPAPPVPGLDLSQFDQVFNYSTFATKIVANVSSEDIVLDVPSGSEVMVMGAMKQIDDLSVRPVSNLDWMYNNDNKTLTISFGETVILGVITIGVFS